MREIRQSGSEGGAIQTNVSFLPLSYNGSGMTYGGSGTTAWLTFYGFIKKEPVPYDPKFLHKYLLIF